MSLSLKIGVGLAALRAMPAPAITVSGLPLADAVAGEAYEHHLTIEGGTPPFSSAVIAGSRPAFLTAIQTGRDRAYTATSPEI